MDNSVWILVTLITAAVAWFIGRVSAKNAQPALSSDGDAKAALPESTSGAPSEPRAVLEQKVEKLSKMAEKLQVKNAELEEALATATAPKEDADEADKDDKKKGSKKKSKVTAPKGSAAARIQKLERKLKKSEDAKRELPKVKEERDKLKKDIYDLKERLKELDNKPSDAELVKAAQRKAEKLLEENETLRSKLDKLEKIEPKAEEHAAAAVEEENLAAEAGGANADLRGSIGTPKAENNKTPDNI